MESKIQELTEKLLKDGVEKGKAEAEKIIAMTSGHRASHAAWLTFMMPRLQLARDLLSKDGVIFISIDDNEQANLKLLCDYLFGEENGIGPIIQNKLNSKNDTLNIQKNHEFIYCYRRSQIIKGGKILASLGRPKGFASAILSDAFRPLGFFGGSLSASFSSFLFFWADSVANLRALISSSVIFTLR